VRAKSVMRWVITMFVMSALLIWWLDTLAVLVWTCKSIWVWVSSSRSSTRPVTIVNRCPIGDNAIHLRMIVPSPHVEISLVLFCKQKKLESSQVFECLVVSNHRLKSTYSQQNPTSTTTLDCGHSSAISKIHNFV